MAGQQRLSCARCLLDALKYGWKLYVPRRYLKILDTGWSYFIKITVSSANFAVSDYCPFGEIIPYTVSITLHFQLDMHETGLWYAILNRIIILRFSVACTQTIY